MEVGQLGRVGRTVTRRVAVAGWFVSVTATTLHLRTMVKTAEKITANTEHATSTVVVAI